MADQAGSWFDRRTVLVCGALLAAALPFAALLLLVVSSWSPLQRLDRAVSATLHGYAVDHPAFTTVMLVVTSRTSVLERRLVRREGSTMVRAGQVAQPRARGPVDMAVIGAGPAVLPRSAIPRT